MLLVGVQTADEPFSQASFPQPPNLLVNGDKPRLRFFFPAPKRPQRCRRLLPWPGLPAVPDPAQPGSARFGTAPAEPPPPRIPPAALCSARSSPRCPRTAAARRRGRRRAGARGSSPSIPAWERARPQALGSGVPGFCFN